MKVVVYYRCRPSEAFYSEGALQEQRQAVDAWRRNHQAELEAEFLEDETDEFSRPKLSQAIETCRSNNATLLVARTEAIGSGTNFSPRIASVPVAIAEQSIRKFCYTVPAPANAPSGLSLRFSAPSGTKNFAVYLCNGTDEALSDVRIQVTSITSKEIISGSSAGDQEPEDTSLTLGRLHSHSLAVIDHYDVLSDGDFISVYDIEFVDARSQRRAVRALVGQGLIQSEFLELRKLR